MAFLRCYDMWLKHACGCLCRRALASECEWQCLRTVETMCVSAMSAGKAQFLYAGRVWRFTPGVCFSSGWIARPTMTVSACMASPVKTVGDEIYRRQHTGVQKKEEACHFNTSEKKTIWKLMCLA